MQIHDPYALERLSDEEFWDLAFAKAFPDSQLNASPIVPGSQPSPTSDQYPPVTEELYVVCDNACAFPIAALYEIITMPQHTTFLPDAPSWMPGLITWRGLILATIDLHAYLLGHTKPVELAHERSLLIAHHGDTLLAFASTVEQTVSLSTTAHTILNVAAIFEDIVFQLKKKATHG